MPGEPPGPELPLRILPKTANPLFPSSEPLKWRLRGAVDLIPISASLAVVSESLLLSGTVFVDSDD
jgi:hypothetical protein